MFTEDFSIFFDTEDFAEEITFQPEGGIGRPVTVIFDRPYYESNSSTAGVATSSPTLLMREIEAPEIEYGDIFIRRFQRFYVRSTEPDGTGLIRVILDTE